MGMHINARKEAISNKLQGSIATHLSFGGDANNQIKKDLLPSLSVNFFLKIGEVTSKEVYCVVYFV